MGKIRVLLVDDHTVVRQGLRRLLESDEEIEIVGEAGGGRTATQLAQRLHPQRDGGGRQQLEGGKTKKEGPALLGITKTAPETPQKHIGKSRTPKTGGEWGPSPGQKKPVPGEPGGPAPPPAPPLPRPAAAPRT